MAGAPPVGRRARTTRTTPSNHVRTILGAHSSSRLSVTSVLRQLCYMYHSAVELPKPHPSGAHSSSRLWVASVPRQLVAWTTPPRNCPSPTHQIRSLRAQSACCTAHFRELPAQAPRSPVDLNFFLRFGAEAYARCATDKHTGINLSKDHRRGLRLLREPIGPHTPLLTEPDRPSRDPSDYGHRALGAHVGAPSLWSSLGRNRRCSWIFWAFSFVDFFLYTRYRMCRSLRNKKGFSTYVDPSCAPNKLLCSLSAENSTTTKLTQPGSLPDLSRSTAFHCFT